MVALMKVYEEEDEAYQDLVTMATQFYQYLLQPFRDMRELATLCKLEILVGSVFMKCTGYIVRVRHHFVLPSFAFTCFCFFFLPWSQQMWLRSVELRQNCSQRIWVCGIGLNGTAALLHRCPPSLHFEGLIGKRPWALPACFTFQWAAFAEV